jgi:hypothetical protein
MKSAVAGRLAVLLALQCSFQPDAGHLQCNQLAYFESDAANSRHAIPDDARIS